MTAGTFLAHPEPPHWLLTFRLYFLMKFPDTLNAAP